MRAIPVPSRPAIIVPTKGKVYSPMILGIAPFITAALLLAAHFLRHERLGLVAVCLLTPFLFMVKRRWSLAVLQALAYLGAAVWLNTTISLVRERMQWERPWAVAAAILGGVALFTVLAGLLLNSAPLKARYPKGSDKTAGVRKARSGKKRAASPRGGPAGSSRFSRCMENELSNFGEKAVYWPIFIQSTLKIPFHGPH